MANPNINKPADVELVFGVKGGGSVSGESGSRILSELRSIVDEINKNHTLEIEFKASDKSLKTGSKSHKKTIKDIKDEADKASMSVSKINTLLRSAVLQQNNIGKSIAQIDLKNMGLSEADTKAVEVQLVKLANVTEKLNALKSSKGANVGNILIEKNALIKEGREIEAEIEKIIHKTTQQKSRLDVLFRLGGASKRGISQIYENEFSGKISPGSADKLNEKYAALQNRIETFKREIESGILDDESAHEQFGKITKDAISLNNEVKNLTDSLSALKQLSPNSSIDSHSRNIDDVLSKALNKDASLRGKTSHSSIFAARLQEVKSVLQKDNELLLKFDSIIDNVNSGTLRDIVKILKEVGDGAISSSEAISRMNSAVAQQWRIGVEPAPEYNDTRFKQAKVIQKAFNDMHMFSSEGTAQTNGKNIFDWIVNKGTKAEQALFNVSEGYKAFQAKLRGLAVGSEDFISYTTTHDLDSLTVNEQQLQNFINSERIAKKETDSLRAEMIQLRESILPGSGTDHTVIDATLEDLERVVKTCPSAQKYIDKLKESLNGVLSVGVSPIESVTSATSVNPQNKSTLESLLGYKPSDIDKALKTVDIAKLTNDQKKGFLDLGSQVDTCKTKFKELLQSSDLFSEESFNDVMALKDAFTKLIESISKYSNIANNTKTNTVANEQVKKQVENTTSYYTSEVNRMLKNVDPSKLQNKDGTLSEGWIKASQAANQYLLEIKAIANSSASMDAKTQALIQAKIKEFATITGGLKSFQREAKTSYASLHQVESLYKKLDNYVRANPRIKGTNEYESIVSMRDQLKEQIDLKDNMTITRDQIRGMNDDFARYDRILGEANKKGNTFVGWVKEGYKRFGGWSLITRTMMSMIRMFKTMISNIKTLDSAMTELKKVTSETSATYEKFLSNATVRAKNLGVTVSDIVNATADFARLGYSISDAEALADAATVYKNVGDGIEDINQASESIISTMQAFGISAENAMNIVDKFNTVGNKFAISSTGVGTALQKSAASMEAANNTLDETIALITAANTVIQNPEVVGKVMPNNAVMHWKKIAISVKGWRQLRPRKDFVTHRKESRETVIPYMVTYKVSLFSFT